MFFISILCTFWNQEFCIKPTPFSSYPEFTKRTKQIFLVAFCNKLTTYYLTVLQAFDPVTCEDRQGGSGAVRGGRSAAGPAHQGALRAWGPKPMKQKQRLPFREGSSNSGCQHGGPVVSVHVGSPRGPGPLFHYKEEGMFLNFRTGKASTRLQLFKDDHGETGL